VRNRAAKSGARGLQRFVRRINTFGAAANARAASDEIDIRAFQHRLRIAVARDVNHGAADLFAHGHVGRRDRIEQRQQRRADDNRIRIDGLRRLLLLPRRVVGRHGRGDLHGQPRCSDAATSRSAAAAESSGTASRCGGLRARLSCGQAYAGIGLNRRQAPTITATKTTRMRPCTTAKTGPVGGLPGARTCSDGIFRKLWITSTKTLR